MNIRLMFLLSMVVVIAVSSINVLGCSIKCDQAYTVEVVNDSGNMLPIHASIDSEVGSAAPKIEPGGSHTLSMNVLEDGTEESFASANLTISRDGEVLGNEHVTFTSERMRVTVFDAVTGGVAFETEAR